MKINNYFPPESSFLSVEKDMNIIANHIFKNERLKRLLYYTDRDALDRPNLTEDQTLELFQNNIKTIPKLKIDPTEKNYIVINFDTFVQSRNPQFRNNVIEFVILCHNDCWKLKDFQLRPYRIAAEIDSMFCNKHLTGIGELQFVACELIVPNDEYSGLCLMYQATHGGEDKKRMPNPADQELFEKDFKDYINAEL